MNPRILLGLSAICMAFGVDPSSAQDAPQGRKLAVIVGNNEYRPNQGLNNLKQAVNDARRLSEALRKAGFTVIEMTHEVASQPGKAVFAPNADYIRDQIEGVVESPNLGERDTILISLHGHGMKFDFEETVVRNGKEEVVKTPKFFFCPADSAPAGIKTANELTERNHLIPLDELYKKLEGCSAATKLLIVDACRNDPNQGNFRESLASLTRPKLPPPLGGIAAFFSCKENQRAVEDADLKQGVFTHFLIKGLEGKADQPLEGKPADGIITLSELTTYVANNTHAYVLDKYKGTRQSPDIKGEFDATLPLVLLPKMKPIAQIIANSLGMKLVLIRSGEFEMGSRHTPQELTVMFKQWSASEDNFNDERPPHRVRLTNDFYLGQHEVTVGQFRQFVDAEGYKTDLERNGWGRGFSGANGEIVNAREYSWRNPSFPQTDSHPVVNVSWNDARNFCVWLSRKERRTYRLPTEAEWEYACKAGTESIWSNGDDVEAVVQIGNIADGTVKDKFSGLNSQTARRLHYMSVDTRDGHVYTAPVGSFPANPFGLFDMHGNALEWCEDAYHAKVYGERSGTSSDPFQAIDPLAKNTPAEIIYPRNSLRGGCWFDNAMLARSAERNHGNPDHYGATFTTGFRVATTK